MRPFGILPGCVAALLMFSSPVHADIDVRFTEGAPKDRFVVTNGSTCEIAAGSITIDLSPSTAGLIFDTYPVGPGENVAQPLEMASTKNVSASFEAVPDGATSAEIRFRNFRAGGEIAVTVDVDDSIRSGPRGVQMIAGSEIAGARVMLAADTTVTGPDGPLAATFDSRGRARIALTGCPHG